MKENSQVIWVLAAEKSKVEKSTKIEQHRPNRKRQKNINKINRNMSPVKVSTFHLISGIFSLSLSLAPFRLSYTVSICITFHHHLILLFTVSAYVCLRLVASGRYIIESAYTYPKHRKRFAAEKLWIHIYIVCMCVHLNGGSSSSGKKMKAKKDQDTHTHTLTRAEGEKIGRKSMKWERLQTPKMFGRRYIYAVFACVRACMGERERGEWANVCFILLFVDKQKSKKTVMW